MVTLKDIAKECNVSMTTVSNILNGKARASEETIKHVKEVVEKYGYKPNYVAQGLRKSKTSIIGVIVEDMAQFTSPELLEGITYGCELHGYKVFMQNLRMYARWSDKWFEEDTQLHSVVEPAMQEIDLLHADGMLYVAGHARIIDSLDKCDIPSGMVYAYAKSKNIPNFILDDVEGAYQAMKYLISKGHKKIGVLMGRPDNFHSQNRLIGVKKALEEYNLPIEESLLLTSFWSRQVAYKRTKELLDQNVTAIFTFTDTMAAGVYDYCEENNLKVGKDISVIGYDNKELSEYLRPALTTMALPLRAIGQMAAEKLIAKIENPTEVTIDNINPWASILVERNSVCDLTK